jgi:hypothetical protein
MSELLPKLKRIIVDPQKKLYLDPNNPRFITRDEDRIDEERFLDQDVITKTRERMLGLHQSRKAKDEFDIEEIKQSILSNGWNPVDSIFVRRFHEDEERFVVIEGNRRVTAIQQILDSAETPSAIREQLNEIEVMEVLDKVAKGRNREKSLREIEKKISYLLGVRHHGSLKKWSPFAQASSIYEKYLRIADQDDDTFLWLEDAASAIAKTLTMQTKEVKERLQTYKCMKQLGSHDVVKGGEQSGGGIKDHHYSVAKEVLQTRESELRKYIAQDTETFLLDTSSLERLVNLCHFDRKDREGSPINNPQQWRFLGKILKDDDPEARAKNLRRVEELKEKPEDVWSEREAELQTPEWAGWLEGVSRLFQDLPFQKFDPSDDKQREVMSRLVAVVNLLSEKERNEQ